MLKEKDIIARMKKVGQRGFPSFKANGLTPESPLNHDTVRTMGLDSMDMVGYTLDLETEFGLQIPDDVLGEFQTVGDLINYLKNKGK